MVTLISRWDRQQRQLRLQRRSSLFPRKLSLSFSRRKLFRFLLIALAIIAILPPLYFHFSLRRFHQMDAYNTALSSQVDCIEIDVSRSSDGIVDLGSIHQHSLEHDVNIPTIEDALKLVSGSVRQVILDAKVGPPLYEKGLAKDILSVVGYIVMIDPSTGSRMNLLRMRGAGVVGVYHPLIDEKLVKILHGRKKKVYAWTVDEEEWMQKMLLEGVDAVVTSNPSLLQRVMQDVRTQCIEEGFSLNS
ncbi:hypothetical protein DH2020_049535 [Rehmannia glutinosa]|uniref:glycerophosphodiester phosphodiesterase n=1 Tax=Rehmannia glutinosa TaxID=99300 RepID=A0ABR0U3C6_REHGL